MTYPPQQGPPGPPPPPPYQPVWTPPTPRQPKRSPAVRRFNAICLGVIATVVIGVAIASLNNNGSSPASSNDAAPAATAAADPVTIAATAKTAEPLGQRVAAWANSGGSDLTSAIGTDLDSLSTDSSNVDYDASGTDCTQLSLDTDKARRYAPIPDKTAQAAWAKALKDLHDAAADCIVGTSTQDASYIEKSGKEVKAGNVQIDKVGARIKVIANG
jgi:hypothetical protein